MCALKELYSCSETIDVVILELSWVDIVGKQFVECFKLT